jgi:hypothetical protein
VNTWLIVAVVVAVVVIALLAVLALRRGRSGRSAEQGAPVAEQGLAAQPPTPADPAATAGPAPVARPDVGDDVTTISPVGISPSRRPEDLDPAGRTTRLPVHEPRPGPGERAEPTHVLPVVRPQAAERPGPDGAEPNRHALPDDAPPLVPPTNGGGGRHRAGAEQGGPPPPDAQRTEPRGGPVIPNARRSEPPPLPAPPVPPPPDAPLPRREPGVPRSSAVPFQHSGPPPSASDLPPRSDGGALPAPRAPEMPGSELFTEATVAIPARRPGEPDDDGGDNQSRTLADRLLGRNR